MDLGVFLGEGLLELERLERTKNRGPVVGIARWVRIGMEGSRDKKKRQGRKSVAKDSEWGEEKKKRDGKQQIRVETGETITRCVGRW